ncbi:dermonecrotic toxin domain-containing protein [Pseudomonas sp. PSKL.D1]|uniref:dermonecrotic toxin domain-containing protein n=1 Tax=Pseudomonas sp. PSKL.D1 TaxID=3029060 RepID=UPI0031590C41
MLDAGRPLVRLVDEIIHAYPDPSFLAREHALNILRKRTGRAMDPRFVWWHQFGRANNTRLTFTGWEHAGPPLKSLLFTELITERFDRHFQMVPDEINQWGGFYRQGPNASFYDQHNEVPMLGSQVRLDFWDIDFASEYQAAVEHFWSAYGRHFRVLAKINMLGRGVIARRAGQITEIDYARLRTMASDALVAGVMPTLEQLQHDSAHSPLTAIRYVLDERDRGCFYSLEAADGRVMLYMPWQADAFRGFDSVRAMARWLRGQLQVAETLDAFASAALAGIQSSAGEHTVRRHLKSIADSVSVEAAEQLLVFMAKPVSADFFKYLSNQARDDMRHTTGLMLSNSDLRKAMWKGYLAAFLKVFAGFAPLGWPMTLMLLGASVAKVGLDVDEAVHAHDEQSRKSALREAMLDSLFAALNMADLGFQSSFATLAYEVPAHELSVPLEHWEVVHAPTLSLQSREANEMIAVAPEVQGRLRGIRVGSDGSCWIVINSVAYRVRYSPDMAKWLVVPPENPFAFVPVNPVRLNEAGEWELLARPQLLGGSPPVAVEIPSTTSRFWETYTVADGTKSLTLSARALSRQKKLLVDWGIVPLPSGRAPDLDARGLDCVMVDGTPHYSYRHEREYFNSLIEYYTNDESKINEVFRYGSYRHDDEDVYISELADELERLPTNNQAVLYRGGHRSRGTGGERYRSGQLKAGDILVNIDMTSFSENPYKAATFASAEPTKASGDLVGVFDDSSVVYELPAGEYQHATPISPFSLYWDEAESLFRPGNYFRIDSLQQVYGEGFHFIHVTLKQVPTPAAGPVYDLRTGLPFDLSVYQARFKTPGVAQRFFPGGALPASIDAPGTTL